MRRTIAVLTAVFTATALLPAVAAADEHGACGEAYTPIYDIQGSGDESPLHTFPQTHVITEGVVTIDLQLNSEQRGFFLQDAVGDADPTTSDGIFVFHQDAWGFDVSEGDVIRIQAEVDEQFGRTQLENVDYVTVCDSDSIAPLAISTRDFNANPEQYEGMYLQYIGDLYVSDTFNLHRFGDIWLGDDGVIETPSNEYPQGSAALDAFAEDNMNQVVMMGDGSRFSNPNPVPFLSGSGTLRLGDVTTDPTGAIFYDFGNYKMINSTDAVFTPTNLRTGAPDVGGDVVVASFNVLNYWTTLGGRGASTQAQLEAQTDKLVAAIRGMGADVVGLQEIENDRPHDEPIKALVDALNDAAIGDEVWARVDGFNQNVYPIVNEIIYRADRVDFLKNSARTLIDSAFDDFRAGPPHEPDDQLGRRPVAATFQYENATFTVINVHLKSKSCTGAQGADLDQGDGASCHNARRVQQAEAVLDWIPLLQTQRQDADVLVIGDFNAYLHEDPVTTMEDGGLTNLLSAYDSDPYSFNFLAFFAAPHIGRGSLDHVFGTPEIAAQVTDVATWHINADEPRFLDWFDPSQLAPGPYRSSDHDPVLIGLSLTEDDSPGNGHGPPGEGDRAPEAPGEGIGWAFGLDEVVLPEQAQVPEDKGKP